VSLLLLLLPVDIGKGRNLLLIVLCLCVIVAVGIRGVNAPALLLLNIMAPAASHVANTRGGILMVAGVVSFSFYLALAVAELSGKKENESLESSIVVELMCVILNCRHRFVALFESFQNAVVR
jgi:hypothetical protein